MPAARVMEVKESGARYLTYEFERYRLKEILEKGLQHDDLGLTYIL